MSSVKDLPIEQRVWLHTELVRHGSLPSCLTCAHAEEKQDSTFTAKYVICAKWNAEPPLAVLVNGCIGWQQDIPF